MKIKFDREMSLRSVFELLGFRLFENEYVYYDDRRIFSIDSNIITVDFDNFEEWCSEIFEGVKLYETAYPKVEVTINIVDDINLKNISFLATDDNVL
jgi:hypothetical protein